MGTGDITISSRLSGCQYALQNIILGDEA